MLIRINLIGNLEGGRETVFYFEDTLRLTCQEPMSRSLQLPY